MAPVKLITGSLISLRFLPKRKIPKNNLIHKPLTLDKQASFSPKLRDKSAIVQDILESMPRSNCVEKQEQKRKAIEPLQMRVSESRAVSRKYRPTAHQCQRGSLQGV